MRKKSKKGVSSKSNKYFDLFKLTKGDVIIFKNSLARKAGFEDKLFMQIRGSEEYNGKAFFLCKDYKWELKEDSSGSLVLIPTKRE